MGKKPTLQGGSPAAGSSTVVLDEYKADVAGRALEWSQAERQRRHELEMLGKRDEQRKPEYLQDPDFGIKNQLGKVRMVDDVDLFTRYSELKKSQDTTKMARMHGVDPGTYMQMHQENIEKEAQLAREYHKSSKVQRWADKMRDEYGKRPDDYAPETLDMIEEYESKPLSEITELPVPQRLSDISPDEIFGKVYSTKETGAPIKGTNMYWRSVEVADPVAFRTSSELLATRKDQEAYAARRMYAAYQETQTLLGKPPKNFVDWSVSMYKTYNKTKTVNVTRQVGSGLTIGFGKDGQGSNERWRADQVAQGTNRLDLGGGQTWDLGGGYDLTNYYYKGENPTDTWQSKGYYVVDGSGNLKKVDKNFDGKGQLMGVYPSPEGDAWLAAVFIPATKTQETRKSEYGDWDETVDVTTPAQTVFMPYEPLRSTILGRTSDPKTNNGWQLPADASATVPLVKTQAEYDKLPPGTRYRDSKGNIGIKK
jgi:hypothetical protein